MITKQMLITKNGKTKKKKKIHINPLVKERNLSCAIPLLLMVRLDNSSS